MYNILFVDDDVFITESIKNMVDWTSLKLNPPFLANGFQQAVNTLQNYSIQIVVSDIEMLGEDGFALLEWIKHSYPDIRCCFLTCHARFDYAQRAIKAGIYDYMLKPVCKPELQAFLQQCIASFGENSSEPPKQYSSTVTAVMNYIQDNLDNVISREKICKELYISERHLSRLFNNEVGMTLTDYITECRIQKSMELLVDTDMSITDICIKAGFNYPAYFTKIFKKRTGLTPLVFRKQQSEPL